MITLEMKKSASFATPAATGRDVRVARLLSTDMAAVQISAVGAAQIQLVVAVLTVLQRNMKNSGLIGLAINRSHTPIEFKTNPSRD